MYSPLEHEPELTREQKQELLSLARSSIQYGFDHDAPLPVIPADYSAGLQARRAAFVTLEHGGDLRGCIGSLEATRPLVIDVSENAFAAAFRDPRFTPLRRDEFEGLALHISLLSPLEPLPAASDAELLHQLRPGLDGLLLEAGWHRGTFLPSVWNSLPEPREFLSHLKQKAGLPDTSWPEGMKVFRYTAEVIS